CSASVSDWLPAVSPSACGSSTCSSASVAGIVIIRASRAASSASVISLSRFVIRNRNHVVELLELAKNKRAMRPRAGKRNVKMIAAALGGKSADAGRSRAAVGGHVIVEYGRPADEMTAFGARAKFFAGAVLLPNAVHQQSHHHLRRSRAVPRAS